MSSAVQFFKDNLKKIMEDNKMSQKELAQKVGIVPQALNKYLMGHRIPGLEVIDKFAQALGVSPSSLLENTKQKKAIYLTREDVFEAFQRAYEIKMRECTLKGLSVEQQETLERLVFEFGGWLKLYHFLEEEVGLVKKGKKEFDHVKGQLFGPQKPYGSPVSTKEIVTQIQLKDKDL